MWRGHDDIHHPRRGNGSGKKGRGGGLKNPKLCKHRSLALSFIPRKAAILAYKWRVPSLVELGYTPPPHQLKPEQAHSNTFPPKRWTPSGSTRAEIIMSTIKVRLFYSACLFRAMKLNIFNILKRERDEYKKVYINYCDRVIKCF